MVYRCILFSLLLISLILFNYCCLAQVGDIKKEVEKEKENSNNNSGGNNNNSGGNNNNSGGNNNTTTYPDPNYSWDDCDSYSSNNDIPDQVGKNIVSIIVNGIGGLIGDAQTDALGHKKSFPEIISLETSLCTGLYLKENGTIYNPRIQGNWGVFSSEFRYTHISDLSGKLGTLDWQILKINIPINPIRISGGLGFTNIPDIKSTYFESSARVDVWFWKRRINTYAEFRSTGKISRNRFRQEFNFQVDYKIKSFGHLHISPMVGIKQQVYLEKYEQTYFMVGVNFRIQ